MWHTEVHNQESDLAFFSDFKTSLNVPRARYDARARAALKRVAGWLGVPWCKAVAFETLLAHQASACTLQCFARQSRFKLENTSIC